MVRDHPGQPTNPPDPPTERLAQIILDVGPRVGALCGLDPPESLCAPLFLYCTSRFHTFKSERGSLRNWVWICGRSVGIKEWRKLRSQSFAPLTGDVPDSPDDIGSLLEEVFLDDGPAFREDISADDIAAHIESRRSYWRLKREESWAAAHEAAMSRELRNARLNAYRSALYEVLLETPTNQLASPFQVLFLGLERDRVARQGGVSTNAVDKRIQRLRDRVKARSKELASKLDVT